MVIKSSNTNNGCFSTIYQQVDLSASFSVLNGLPIPYSSIGTVIPELLESSPKSSILYSLYYSNKKLIGMLERQTSEVHVSNYECFVQYQEAISFHKMFLNDPKNYFAFNISYNKYLSSSASLSSILASKFFKVEIFLMIVGIISSILTSINILLQIILDGVSAISLENNWIFNMSYLTVGFLLKFFILSDLFEGTNDIKTNSAFLIFMIIMHVNRKILSKQLKYFNYNKVKFNNIII